MLLRLSFLALLMGCPQDISVLKVRVDNDSDGYTSEVDCDDARADVNPEGTEACDGVDNDCDGAIDDDATDAERYFLDADGDGHGTADEPLLSCVPVEGYTRAGDDCDDAAPDVHPGEAEVCDGLDNDCNDTVDDNASDTSRGFEDADGDGYGNPAIFMDVCELPADYVGVSTDCDDTNAAVHPDAAEPDCTDPTDYNCDASVGYADADADGSPACEDCDDADGARSPLFDEVCDEADVDEDCDALVDDNDDSVTAASATTWYRDVDRDGYSAGTGLTLVQCDAPAAYSALLGDCDDYDPLVSPGATETCDAYDIDEDCDGLSDDADPTTDPVSFVISYADLDGDGFGDLARAAALCEPVADYVLDGSDCDDADAGRNPGEPEVCDSAAKDEDCDGLSDDADPSATGASTWYVDTDRDGYGDTSLTANACAAPVGYAPTSDDCDDGSATVSPGATEECDAANLDEDCDGLSDDADDSVSSAGQVDFYRDGDSDGYGAGFALARCDAPSSYIDNADDCDDTDATAFPGAALGEDPLDCTRDGDGDGYGDSSASGAVVPGDDCDDADPLVSPVGTEDCSTAADDDCDGSTNVEGALDCTTYLADTDADGYGLPSDTACLCEPDGAYSAALTAAADCDDGNSSVNPGGVEECDAADMDEDCDGLSDDADPSTSAATKGIVYTDSDGDSFGSPVLPTTRCEVPSGYAATATDCNDADADAFPGAAPLDSATACMEDDDFDDYGDATPSAGTPGSDCDDGSAIVNPGAVESCFTSDDDDCSGSTNDLDAVACTDFYDDADLDGYGGGSAACQCVATPDHASALGSDCDDAEPTVSPGATEVCGDAADNDCDGTADDGCPTFDYRGSYVTETSGRTDADAVYYGAAAADAFGATLATDVDFDGDGVDDLAVGASGAMYGSANYGVVYVYEGLPSASAEATTNAVGTLYGSTSATETWGASVWGVDDFNDDGVDELAAARVVGATTYVYLYEGSSLGAPLAASSFYDEVTASGPAVGVGDEDYTYGNDDIAIADVAARSGQGAISLYAYDAAGLTLLNVINGEDANDAAGFGLAGGAGNDTNGDGYDEIFIGAYGDDAGGPDAGAAYVVETPVTSTFDLSAASVKIRGSSVSEIFGRCVAAPGDVDGDGLADMAVGAPRDDAGGSNAGVIYIFEDIDTDAATKDSLNSHYEVKILGQSGSDYLGYWQPSFGDVNGDGEIDILLGSPNWEASAATAGSGAAWLIYGPLSGVYDVASGDDYDAMFPGDGTSDACGTSLGLGDLDADGSDEMMMGCTSGDYSGVAGLGTIYFFAGG